MITRTTLISQTPQGQAGNGTSRAPSVSAGGRYVAFASRATDLTESGPGNGLYHIFVHDRETGATECISREANGESYTPSISADGRFVAFTSSASNLVSDDNNGLDDVFLHDRSTDQIRRLNLSPNGEQANGPSSRAVISSDGGTVVFDSRATNLVPDDTNEAQDIFAVSTRGGQVRRVSLGADGSQAEADCSEPCVNADGSRVGFQSLAGNLVPGDENRQADVFVRDLIGKTTVCASGSANAPSLQPALSGDGQRLAFFSYATDLDRRANDGLGQVFVADLETGRTELVSVNDNGEVADRASSNPALSHSGELVSFQSNAANLGAQGGATNVFVRDTANQVTRAASQGNYDSLLPVLSQEGRTVTCMSLADNFGIPDPNLTYDIYQFEAGG